MGEIQVDVVQWLIALACWQTVIRPEGVVWKLSPVFVEGNQTGLMIKMMSIINLSLFIVLKMTFFCHENTVKWIIYPISKPTGELQIFV